MSAPKKPFKLSIGWGKFPEPENDKRRFTFTTEVEREAFLLGVDAAIGWMQYHIRGEEPRLRPEFTRKLNEVYSWPDDPE